MSTILAFSLMITPMVVKDYGIHGHTFPIEEEDLIECLTKHSQELALQEVHEIDQKLQNHYKKIVAKTLPVKNLKNAIASYCPLL